MFYLTTHSTHFIYSNMVKDHSCRDRKHAAPIYSFRLAARVLLYALSHKQDSTYHGFCYTSHGAFGWNTVSKVTLIKFSRCKHCVIHLDGRNTFVEPNQINYFNYCDVQSLFI